MKIAALLAASLMSLYSADDSISGILINQESLSFSDGSSIYTFNRNGNFALSPNGDSGRTIRGVWKLIEGSRYEIIGVWEWINGEYAPGDKRKMIIDIRPTTMEVIGVNNARDLKYLKAISRLKSY